MSAETKNCLTRRNALQVAGAGLATLAFGTARAEQAPAKPLRAGIIGMDNYQAVEFARAFNDPKAEGDLAGIQVVAAYPGGSPDLKESVEGLPKWIQQIQPFGVKIVDNIDAVMKQVDVAMVMSLDGRTHLELARPALRARKPLFIGRPLAASMVDATRIFDLAREHKTPVFSCSQHRFTPGFADMRKHEEVGEVLGCEVHGGCPFDPTHPDLFWHGVHGVETLYTIMGPGCVSVTRVSTPVTEFVTGTWKDGRVGTYRGIHLGAIEYKAMVYGTKGVIPSGKYGGYAPIKGVEPKGEYAGYVPLAREIGKFFKTRKPPVEEAETLEIFAFMEAAHESTRQQGVPVLLETVLAKARKDARR